MSGDVRQGDTRERVRPAHAEVVNVSPLAPFARAAEEAGADAASHCLELGIAYPAPYFGAANAMAAARRP